MRSAKHNIGIQPRALVYGSAFNKIFSVRNKSTANIIYLQFGSNPGTPDDAWYLGAGEVWTMDPAAPADTIWLWSDVDNIDNRVLLG